MFGQMYTQYIKRNYQNFRCKMLLSRYVVVGCPTDYCCAKNEWIYIQFTILEIYLEFHNIYHIFYTINDHSKHWQKKTTMAHTIIPQGDEVEGMVGVAFRVVSEAMGALIARARERGWGNNRNENRTKKTVKREMNASSGAYVGRGSPPYHPTLPALRRSGRRYTHFCAAWQWRVWYGTSFAGDQKKGCVRPFAFRSCTAVYLMAGWVRTPSTPIVDKL